MALIYSSLSLAHSICFIDEPRNAPRLGSNQTPWGDSSLSSDLQLPMFVEMAEDYDYMTTKRRKVDADAFMKMVSSGTIYIIPPRASTAKLQTLLFTAYVCAAFAVYVHYLRRDSQGIFAFYLEKNCIPTARRPLRSHYIHSLPSQQTSGFVRGPPRQPCFYPEPHSCPGANVGEIGLS